MCAQINKSNIINIELVPTFTHPTMWEQSVVLFSSRCVQTVSINTSIKCRTACSTAAVTERLCPLSGFKVSLGVKCLVRIGLNSQRSDEVLTRVSPMSLCISVYTRAVHSTTNQTHLRAKSTDPFIIVSEQSNLALALGDWPSLGGEGKGSRGEMYLVAEACCCFPRVSRYLCKCIYCISNVWKNNSMEVSDCSAWW